MSIENTQSPQYDVIIVGGGPAGLTAGIYSGRNGNKTLILEGEYVTETDFPGGQLLLTPNIENYPGFNPGAGSDLVEIMREQAENSGATIVTEKARRFTFEEGQHIVHTDDIDYIGKTVIIATGAIAKRLGVEGEDDYFGQGVSTCATCDGSFFAGGTVAVIGGGDTAVEDALYMANIAKKVYLIHRKDELRTQSPESRSLLQKENVEVLFNTQVRLIGGNGKDVTSIVAETDINGVSKTFQQELDGVFVAIGHNPSTECLTDNVQMLDDSGYIVTNDVNTNIPGVFVAGDVADKEYRQAITAAATGAKAAMNAQGYLQVN